ncbi:hypothetical protein [Cryobacterium sp. TMT1-66-1]|uniref:hypothetical protein n=1 Tax=Cryobacterium sp. TMT1-66-1 TaxID=1259242 RepID=UPI001069BCBA|nr:hypothetical protein [Cryobacterium sp. TMT1-66-1]TFD07006.1 hypothetical protein E3T29_08320 [Cryobacterium sp. TMT1-66-1]
MNSGHFDQPDSAFALEALGRIDGDRRRLAARFTAETWWAAPAQALAVAAVVASPAAGVAGPMSVVATLATIALVGIDLAFSKRTGISINRPAGPVSLAVLIALCALIVAAFVTSLALAMIGERSWIIASTSAGFILMLVGVAIYDQAYARDLRRAR